MAETAVGGVADLEHRRLALTSLTAVPCEHLLGGQRRHAEGADHIGIVDASLDRSEIPLLGWPQANDVVAKWLIRDRGLPRATNRSELFQRFTREEIEQMGERLSSR